MTLTDAVIRALEEQVHRTPRRLDCAKLDSLCARIGALPVLDNRAPEEILGYDEAEIPR
jgi:hypothetical protein